MKVLQDVDDVSQMLLMMCLDQKAKKIDHYLVTRDIIGNPHKQSLWCTWV